MTLDTLTVVAIVTLSVVMLGLAIRLGQRSNDTWED